MSEPPAAKESPLQIMVESTHQELERARMQLKEIRLLVEQSQGEVDKLAKRSASVTSRLHQIQASFDTAPRDDIRSAYDAAQDAQQRLFTMRGQLEKLKSDQAHLERLVETLSRMHKFLESGETLELSPRAKSQETGIQQIIEAQEDERLRLSRQIHDGPAQVLSNFILQAEIAMRLLDRDPEKAREEMANLKAAAASTFSQMRSFIFDLRPMMLDDLGLIPTVRRYVDSVQEKSGLEISLVTTGTERRIEPHREVIVFRAIQELLRNAREHAKATQVKVMLDLGDEEVRAVVEDNGQGFDAQLLASDELHEKGLRSLEKRLQQAGGSMDIESLPGEGTRITFSIPSTPGA
jgi:two-component system sensor histidine kinase DegS